MSKQALPLFFLRKTHSNNGFFQHHKKNFDFKGTKQSFLRIYSVSVLMNALLTQIYYIMNIDEFSIFTRRLRSEIVAIGYRYLKNDEEAEDNAQDTLLKLWTIRGRLQQTRPGNASLHLPQQPDSPLHPAPRLLLHCRRQPTGDFRYT